MRIKPVPKLLSKMHQNHKGSSSNHAHAHGSILDFGLNYSLEIGIILITFGILCGFFGKKFVKPVSFLTGFIVGASMSLGVTVLKIMSPSSIQNISTSHALIIGASGGILIGTLMLAFYKLIIYGILGLFLAVLSALLCWEMASAKAAEVLQYPIALASFVIGTFAASFVPTFSTIIVTSGLGSYILTVGIDCILKSGFNHVFAFGFCYKYSEVSTNTSDEIFGLLAFWIVMFLWMGIRQMITKDSSKVGKFKVKNQAVHGKEIMEA